MGRLRIVQIEVESDDSFSALIHTALGGRIQETIHQSSENEPEEPVKLEPSERKKRALKPAKLRAAPGGGETLTEKVFESLKKKPKSSIELQEALDLQPAQVYGACNHLKNQGRVESHTDDDGDGTRRWFVK